MTKSILSTKEAAEYLSMSTAFLERDRWAGARIPFFRIGTRTVRYLKSDLDEYLNAQIKFSTIEWE